MKTANQIDAKTTPRNHEATRSTIERKVAALRAQAERDPLGARDQAWSWFHKLGKTARKDYGAAAVAMLDELFALGRVPTPIDGPTDGLILTWGRMRGEVRIINATLRPTVPWVGKMFDAASATGYQRLEGWRKWATPWVVLLPLNALFGNHRRPGPFVTRVATGLVKPAPQVLVLDYDVPGNLSAVRPIIDELVEIVPGANFGRALYRRGESYTVTAYFALHSAIAHSD